MDQATVAIIISVFSVLLAALSLGWNVYRDVVLKPKVVVTIAIKNIVCAGMAPSPDYIGISATNHGPGSVKLNAMLLKETSIAKKLKKQEKNAFIVHDYENPYSSKLPLTLEVGEHADYFFPYDEECMFKSPFTHVGVSDSFSRVHWAPKKSVKKLREKWVQKFEENT